MRADELAPLTVDMPKLPILNREQSRRLDQRAQDEFGISGLVLMENAGRSVVDSLVRLGARSPVVICCGKGNNAGDGFVIARHLDLRKIEARILLFASPAELQGDALANYQIAERAGLNIEVFAPDDSSESADSIEKRLPTHLDEASWIVDALLGTGVRGAARPPFDQVINLLNACAVPILAVDLPSGLDCDRGPENPPLSEPDSVEQGRTVPSIIRATHTCTFVAHKPGFLVAGADRFTGKVEVLDIGAPRRLIEEMLAEARSS